MFFLLTDCCPPYTCPVPFISGHDITDDVTNSDVDINDDGINV